MKISLDLSQLDETFFQIEVMSTKNKNNKGCIKK